MSAEKIRAAERVGGIAAALFEETEFLRQGGDWRTFLVALSVARTELVKVLEASEEVAAKEGSR